MSTFQVGDKVMVAAGYDDGANGLVGTVIADDGSDCLLVEFPESLLEYTTLSLHDGGLGDGRKTRRFFHGADLTRVGVGYSDETNNTDSDPEIEALHAIVNALDSVDSEAHGRIAAFLADRYDTF